MLLVFKELKRIVNQIRRICEEKGSGTSTYDSEVHDDSDVVLTIHDDISAVVKVANDLGYELNEEDQVKVYEAFTRIAAASTAAMAELTSPTKSKKPGVSRTLIFLPPKLTGATEREIEI